MNIGMGIGGVVLVLIIIAIIFADRPPPGYIPESADLKLENQPSLGNPEAPLKVVEFGDYQCIHCKDFHDTVYPEFKEEYVDTGKAQFHFITFPGISLASTAAANAAMCMYIDTEEGFWQLHDALFENINVASQFVEGQDAMQNLITENVSVPFDQDTVFQCIRDQDAQEIIEENKSIAANARIGVTPVLLVNRRIAPDTRAGFLDFLGEELSSFEDKNDE